jgi:hypothetical protein
MKNSVTVGIIAVLTILLSFYLSAAFAGNENVDAIKSINTANATKNMTSMSQNNYAPEYDK